MKSLYGMQRMGLRLPLLALPLIVLFGSPHPAMSQPTWTLGQPLPEMVATFCLSAESATQFAAQANNLSFARPSGCYRSRVRVTPQGPESRIAPFSMHDFRYDPMRRNPVRHRWNGIEHEINVVITESLARVYVGRIQLADDREIIGWVFIPDDPYPLAYARATGARIMP